MTSDNEDNKQYDDWSDDNIDDFLYNEGSSKIIGVKLTDPVKNINNADILEELERLLLDAPHKKQICMCYKSLQDRDDFTAQIHALNNNNDRKTIFTIEPSYWVVCTKI